MVTGRRRIWTRSALFASIAPALLLVGAADAVDGVIEINQTRALAGGVTPSDTPGFPVTLDAAGASVNASYRLTSNLVLPDLDTTGIVVTSITKGRATIDLNGFEIRGPNTCFGPPPNCGNGTGKGIEFVPSGFAAVAIRNGTVGGVGDACMDLSSTVGTNSLVQDVHVRDCGGDGIVVGPYSRVERCQVWLVEGVGVEAGTAAIVDECAVRGAGLGGIDAGGSGTVTGSIVEDSGSLSGSGFGIKGAEIVRANVIRNTTGDGIFVTSGAVVRENSISQSSGFGLRLACGAGGCPFGGNSMRDNNGGNANPQLISTGGFEVEANVCGTDTTCP